VFFFQLSTTVGNYLAVDSYSESIRGEEQASDNNNCTALRVESGKVQHLVASSSQASSASNSRTISAASESGSQRVGFQFVAPTPTVCCVTPPTAGSKRRKSERNGAEPLLACAQDIMNTVQQAQIANRERQTSIVVADAQTSFGNMVANELRKMPEVQKRLVKGQITRLLFFTEFPAEIEETAECE
jgi:hypothetical protein